MVKVTMEKVQSCCRKGSPLTLATLSGVIGGVVFGLCLRTREGNIHQRDPKGRAEDASEASIRVLYTTYSERKLNV